MKRFLKKLNLIRRCYSAIMATKYYNFKYLQIFKWAFTSNEDTNFTYELTDKNNLELLKTIELCFNI